jgi:cytidyltransferase-like protein
MTDDAVIIGRFQPLHLGHEDLIEYARDSYDEVTLLTAEGQDHPSDRNPLTLEERDEMLDAAYDDASDINRGQLHEDNEGIHEGIETVTDELASYHDDPEDVVCLTENPETIEALGDTYEIEAPPDNEFRDKPYRGGHVREQAATDGDWQDYVSDEVASVLESYGFEERMDDLWDEK